MLRLAILVFAMLSSSAVFAAGPMVLGAEQVIDDQPAALDTGTIAPAPGQFPMRQEIAFKSSLVPGSILIRTAERRLYFILPGGRALAFRIGVGRRGYSWHGVNTVSHKSEWPDWRPPPEMIAREADYGHVIPDFMKGGPRNPLGARAIYIGDTDYRIHGTNKPWTIGYAVSSGCIRMLNENVIELYELVKVGARIVVE